MKNIRHEFAIWVQAVTIILIWLGLIYISRHNLSIDWEAFKQIPDVVLLYGALHLAFTHRMWRWKVFRGWLVPLPDLQGTWRGEIRSTWQNPETGLPSEPIPLLVVVRQSFDAIGVTIHTRESTSVSTAATLIGGDDGQLALSYMYSNRPRVSVRHRSSVHDGAAVLRVMSGDPMKLEGEYWTNRQTTGEMSLRFRDSQLADGFVD